MRIKKVSGTVVLQGNIVDSLNSNSSLNAPSIRAVNEGLSKIIESGDGYIKYSDGTMICYGTSDITAQITNPWGSSYYGNVKVNPTFAKPFISPPTISATIRTTGNLANVAGISTSTTKITAIFLITFASQDSYTGKLDWVAIGKWKSDAQIASDEPSSEDTISDEPVSDEETI